MKRFIVTAVAVGLLTIGTAGVAAAQTTGSGSSTPTSQPAGAPGKAQQDLLCLVVTGVTEHDGHGTDPFGDILKGPVSRVPRLSLGAGAGACDLDRHYLDGVK